MNKHENVTGLILAMKIMELDQSQNSQMHAEGCADAFWDFICNSLSPQYYFLFQIHTMEINKSMYYRKGFHQKHVCSDFYRRPAESTL